MRTLKIGCLFFILLCALASCNFNYSESGLRATDYKEELHLAKKSLRYLSEGKKDSLRHLLEPNLAETIDQKSMNLLIENGQRILSNYQFPHDSIITVSKRTNQALTGKTIYKEFQFPFELENQKDSTKYFRVTIAENQIHKLYIRSYF